VALLPAGRVAEKNLNTKYAPLTSDGVIGFLLARGLVSEQMLVEADVRVEETAGRNHNFRFMARGGRSYFLKQALPEDLEDLPLEVEAELYRCVLEEPSWSHLAGFVPRFRLYDARQAVLVVDLELGLKHVGGFGDVYSFLGLAHVSEPMARALAACHRTNPSATASNLGFLPRAAPGILRIGRPHASALRYLSPAQIQIIQVIQDRPALQGAFDEIRTGWTATCLVHGDVRWANVLVRVDAQSGAPTGVMLIDWELARWGDTAWDVGSVFHSYLLHGVLTAPVPAHSRPLEAAEAIGAVLPSFHNELGTFWDTYCRAAPSRAINGRSLLGRAIQCCIARLVQSAYELSDNAATIPGRAAAILQLAINMLTPGDTARKVVLGGLAEK
jgi:hypothetical protein